jgi:predicted nucleic acid-binding protein
VARLERDDALATTTRLARSTASPRSPRAGTRIEPVESVRETATRLLRVHDLSAADALQLAAALLAAEGSPRTLAFVCLDRRLAVAAQREGFPVVS